MSAFFISCGAIGSNRIKQTQFRLDDKMESAKVYVCVFVLEAICDANFLPQQKNACIHLIKNQTLSFFIDIFEITFPAFA
jgi:hypothetical protein